MAGLDARGVSSDVRHVMLAVVVGVCLCRPPGYIELAATSTALVVSAGKLFSHRPGVASWAAAGLALLMYASSAWSALPVVSARYGVEQLMAVGLFIALRAGVDSRRGLMLVGAGYVIGSLVLLQKLVTENGLTENPEFGLGTTTRYTVEGLNENFVSYTLVSGIAVAVLLTVVAPKAKPWLVVTIVGFLVGIWLTGTRGSGIAVVGVLAWWLLVPARLRTVGLKVLVGVVGVVAVAITTGIADNLPRQLFPMAAGRDYGDLNGRLVVWPIAREMFAADPVLGNGAGAVATKTPSGIAAHNVILDVGSGVGALGVALIIVALWYAVAPLARRGRTGAMLAGVAIAASAPPLLSGYWYQSMALWILLALFSTAVLLIRPSDAVPDRVVSEGLGGAGRSRVDAHVHGGRGAGRDREPG